MYEEIKSQNKLIALIIKSDFIPDERIKFFTPPDFNQQIGVLKCPAGEEIKRHIHKPLQRNVLGTSEAILMQKGKMEVLLYNERKELIATRILTAGDVIFLMYGGHGFKMLEDSILLEVKQGPYAGTDDKERF